MAAPLSPKERNITKVVDAVRALQQAIDLSGAEILAALLTVDGAGSGLDADLLDGVSSAALLHLAGGTMAGTLAMNGNLLTGAFLDNYEEEVAAIGAIGGGAQDIDASKPMTTATVDTSETTFSFINPPSSGNVGSFTLRLTNGGSQTVNWPASVLWPGNIAPSLTAAGIDKLVFDTIDGGTTWDGHVAGLDMRNS